MKYHFNQVVISRNCFKQGFRGKIVDYQEDKKTGEVLYSVKGRFFKDEPDTIIVFAEQHLKRPLF
jgi:hypothetical protein